MKLFLVKRTDVWDYDEYEGIVVRAEDEERALAIATKRNGPGLYDAEYPGMRADNITATEIAADGDEEVILTSFHAG